MGQPIAPHPGPRRIPLERLGRPRIDVTLRISGFFRDAFPHLIELVDRAGRRWRSSWTNRSIRTSRASTTSPTSAARRSNLATEERGQARYRIFGAKPGTYGAGIQALIETSHWETDQDFAKVFVEWGGYAYGRDSDGVDAREVFADRLATIEVAVHNQDNREHDIFDSDDYYQFHGGMIATVRALTGNQPKAYFGDSSRPERCASATCGKRPCASIAAGSSIPSGSTAIRRHGYKGGLELTTTVDYIFGFDATAHVAPDFVYEGLAETLRAATRRMRNFWPGPTRGRCTRLPSACSKPPSAACGNSRPTTTLAQLRQVLLEAETLVEARGERVYGAASDRFHFSLHGARRSGSPEARASARGHRPSVERPVCGAIRARARARRRAALAASLPDGAPFVNLPIGATEDRLLGGLDIERALQGEPR